QQAVIIVLIDNRDRILAGPFKAGQPMSVVVGVRLGGTRVRPSCQVTIIAPGVARAAICQKPVVAVVGEVLGDSVFCPPDQVASGIVGIINGRGQAPGDAALFTDDAVENVILVGNHQAGGFFLLGYPAGAVAGVNQIIQNLSAGCLLSEPHQSAERIV